MRHFGYWHCDPVLRMLTVRAVVSPITSPDHAGFAYWRSRQSPFAQGTALSRNATVTKESVPEIVDPVIGRFLDAVLDGAWSLSEHAGGLSRRPRGTLALARATKYYPLADQPRRSARLHCRARRGRLASALDRPAAVVVSPLFPLPDARGRRARDRPRRSPCRASAARCPNH